MRPRSIVLIAAAFICWTPCSAPAQQWHGFTGFTVNRDLNDASFAGAAGGVLLDLARSWVSVGAQADLFVSGWYFAGRGGPIAQLNLLRGPVRVFAVGGTSWGEQAGPMIGGGVDIGARGRIGLRVTVQDYFTRVEGLDCAFFGIGPAECSTNFHGGRSYLRHQPSFQIGIVWR